MLIEGEEGSKTEVTTNVPIEQPVTSKDWPLYNAKEHDEKVCFYKKLNNNLNIKY